MKESLQVFIIASILDAAKLAYSRASRVFPRSDVKVDIADFKTKTFFQVFPWVEQVAAPAIETAMLMKGIAVTESNLRNLNVDSLTSSAIALSSFDFSAVEEGYESEYINSSNNTPDIQIGTPGSGVVRSFNWETQKLQDPSVVAAAVAAAAGMVIGAPIVGPTIGVPTPVSAVVEPTIVSYTEDEFAASIAALQVTYPGSIICGAYRPYKTPADELKNYEHHCSKSDAEKDAAFEKARQSEDHCLTRAEIEGEFNQMIANEVEVDQLRENMLGILLGDPFDFSKDSTDLTTPGFKVGVKISIGKGPEDKYDDGDLDEVLWQVDSYVPSDVIDEMQENEIIPGTAYSPESGFGIQSVGNFFIFPNNPSNPGALDLTKKFFVIPVMWMESNDLRKIIIREFKSLDWCEDISL